LFQLNLVAVWLPSLPGGSTFGATAEFFLGQKAVHWLSTLTALFEGISSATDRARRQPDAHQWIEPAGALFR
jgi:hypothetical protein